MNDEANSQGLSTLSPEPLRRKLAAILAADVVGFAGLVAQDEEGTIARLDRLFADIVRMHIETRRGRVFKSLGDGVLAEFSSTVEAVNCAIGIQTALALNEHEPDNNQPLRLRISDMLEDKARMAIIAFGLLPDISTTEPSGPFTSRPPSSWIVTNS